MIPCKAALACDTLPWEFDGVEPDDFQKEPLRAVTIGIGFLCQDGLIIAADTQYTQGSFKSHGPKLFDLSAISPNLALIIGGAGNVPFMRRAVTTLTEELIDLTNPTMNDVRDAIEDTLGKFFAKHIYVKPSDQHKDYRFGFIMGIWTRRSGFDLFTTSEAIVNTVPRNGSTAYCSIGTGQYVSDYALELIYEPGLNVENAKFAAAFAIKAAKEHVGSCGGTTRISGLRFDGTACRRVRIYAPEIDEAEKDSSDVFDAAKHLIGYLDIDTDDADVGEMTNQIRDSILELRKKRRDRRERSAAIRAALGKKALP